MTFKPGELRRLLHLFGVALMISGILLSVLMIADAVFKIGGSNSVDIDASFKIVVMMGLGGALYLLASIDRRLAERQSPEVSV